MYNIISLCALILTDFTCHSLYCFNKKIYSYKLQLIDRGGYLETSKSQSRLSL